MCRHIERSVNLDKVSAQLSKSKLSLSQCEDCANDIKTGTGKESKGRSSQKKAARLTSPAHNTCHQEEKWVCLACGHVACGALSDHQSVDGEAEYTERGEKKDEIRAPTSGHAWKHSVLAKHPVAMQASDNLVCWCFICNMPIEHCMPEGLPLNSHDNTQLVSWRTRLVDAANILQERLLKKKGGFKDPAKTCYTMDPVRCVLDTVRCVIDSATHLKTVDVGNPSTQYTGSGKKHPVKGLMNLGNTCFFNSIMQNLLALSVLRDHFSQEPRDGEGPLTSSLRSLYQEINSEHVPMTSLNGFSYEHGSKRPWKGPAMWGSSEKACNPRSLFDAICTKAPRFRGFQQQDSHELLRYLLEGLNLEERSAKALPNGNHKNVLSTPSSKAQGQNGQVGDLELVEDDREHGNTKKVGHPPQVIPTFVESVFGGQLSSTVHCCECGHVSVVNETMLDLSLQIPTRQTLKKRQACENLGELSLFGERSHKGSLHEDSKPVEPAQMMGAQETLFASASVAVESKEYFLNASSSEQADRINPFWTEVAESTEVTFDDKFSVHDFDSLVSGGGGLQSAEGSLQNCFDVPYCADDRENTLFADVQDCIPRDPLTAGWDPLPLEKNAIMNGHKDTDTWWGVVSASADGVPSGVLQNEKICVESLTTNAFEQPQDKHVLVHSKDEPSVSGSLLLRHGHSEVASNCREQLSQFTYAATECTYEKSLCVEGKGLPCPVLETKECSQSCSQLIVEGAETLFDIGRKMEAPKGHMEGNQVTRKSISIGEADGEASSDIGKGAVKSEQCIDTKDNVSPLSLEACLADFIKSELLCGDNAWECESCSRLAEEKTHPYNNLRTRDGHLSIEVMVDSKELGEDFLGQKDGRVALVDAEVSSIASSGAMEGDCSLSAIGDHKVEQTRGCANLTTLGGDQHNGDDCVTFEMGNHGNITHTLADVSKNYQRNELGTGEVNNDDKTGGAHSSVVEKSVILSPLVKKHLQPEGHGLGHTCSKMLPSLRKEKLSFFSGLFFKTENHKAKSGQQQKLVRRNATKKFLISKAPLVLTVHLKRFAQDARGRLNKLCGHVAFSEFLDLQPFLDPRCIDYNNCIYRLVGIVEHGGTMRGGHYVAYVRGPCMEETSDSVDHDKDSWYHISDSSVQKSTLQDVLGREAYLLFYERHNAKEER